MSTILSSHPETSIWSVPSAPLKLHSRAREAETACCAGVTITKSLERIEIPQCIYDSCDGLGLFSQDPIGFAGGDANLYRYVGNSPTMATDPSGLRQATPEEAAELARLLALEKQMRDLASRNPGNRDYRDLADRISRAHTGFSNRIASEAEPSSLASVGVLGGGCLLGSQADSPVPGPADAIAIIVFVFGAAGIFTFGPSIPVITSEIRESADALSELVLQSRRLGEQVDRVHDALKSYFEHMGKIDGKGGPSGGDPKEWWRKWVEDAQKAIRIARDRWNDLKNCKQKDELKKHIDDLEEALRKRAEEMGKLHE